MTAPGSTSSVSAGDVRAGIHDEPGRAPVTTPTLVAAERRTLTFPLTDVQVRDATDGAGFTITGHAAVFGRPSDDLGGFKERIQRGAFRKPLAEQQDVRLLINHNDDLLLARTANGTLTLSEDERGLRVQAQAADVSYARDLRVLMTRGDLTQMSFRFNIAAGGYTWSSDGKLATLTAVDTLFDVSVVTIPAYPDATAQMRNADREAQTRKRALLALADTALALARAEDAA